VRKFEKSFDVHIFSTNYQSILSVISKIDENFLKPSLDPCYTSILNFQVNSINIYRIAILATKNVICGGTKNFGTIIWNSKFDIDDLNYIKTLEINCNYNLI
jgi:hypothetical protein